MNEEAKGQRFAERSGSFIGLALLGGRLLDRVGAFGQVLLIAAVLGSTTRADLYFIASIVPLTIGNVVGEAFAAAVLPRAAKAGEPEATRLFSAGLWLSGLALVALTTAYLVAVAIFVPVLTPAGTASLLPWLAFAPLGIFFGLTAYCAAPLLHYERYVWPALRGATATIVGFRTDRDCRGACRGCRGRSRRDDRLRRCARPLVPWRSCRSGARRIFVPPSRSAVREIPGALAEALRVRRQRRYRRPGLRPDRTDPDRTARRRGGRLDLVCPGRRLHAGRFRPGDQRWCVPRASCAPMPPAPLTSCASALSPGCG